MKDRSTDQPVKVDYLFKRGVRYCATHRKRLMKPEKGPAKFPRSFKLTPEPKAHHYWWKSDIDAFVLGDWKPDDEPN